MGGEQQRWGWHMHDNASVAAALACDGAGSQRAAQRVEEGWRVSAAAHVGLRMDPMVIIVCMNLK